LAFLFLRVRQKIIYICARTRDMCCDDDVVVREGLGNEEPTKKTKKQKQTREPFPSGDGETPTIIFTPRVSAS